LLTVKKNFSLIALLIASLSVSVTASGCGKKGPPMPPEEQKSLTAPAEPVKPQVTDGPSVDGPAMDKPMEPAGQP